MNAVAERPAIERSRRPRPMTELPPQSARAVYAIGFFAALGVHALILFGLQKKAVDFEPVEFAVEAATASVEVSLVAALPAEEPAVVPQTPEPEPAPAQPEPEPVPVPIEEPAPPEKPPEMTRPEPISVQPPKPKRVDPPRVEPKKLPPKPQPVNRPAGDGSAPVPGKDATTAKAASGAVTSRPGYLSNPHPAYPEAARAAKQQGVVTLKINVAADGRVAGVRITRSSGFLLLDERAQSTVSQRWRFKPARAGGVPVATEVVVPIRFILGR